MKTDPRTRYTKSLIQSTFIALLHDKPASRITVSEICAKAEINRGTFYRYYLDVYDLVDRMMEESLDQVDDMINTESGESFESTFCWGASNHTGRSEAILYGSIRVNSSGR